MRTTTRAGGLAVATLTTVAALGSGLAYADGAAAASPRSGAQQIVFVFDAHGGHERPTRVLATGPISGRGTETQHMVTGHGTPWLRAVLHLPGGTVVTRIEEQETTEGDYGTCTAVETGTGSWRVIGGTGRYRHASGQGTFASKVFIVAAYDRHGSCLGPSAPPALATAQVVAHGESSRGAR